MKMTVTMTMMTILRPVFDFLQLRWWSWVIHGIGEPKFSSVSNGCRCFSLVYHAHDDDDDDNGDDDDAEHLILVGGVEKFGQELKKLVRGSNSLPL